MQDNQPIYNEQLKKLLGEVRSNPDENNMIKLLQEAAASTFIVPVEGEEGAYSFHAVTGKDNRVFMVVYSDSDSFAKAFPGKAQNGVAAGFADVLEACAASGGKLDGFVINPGEEEVLFGKDMIELILGEMKSGSGEGGTASGDAPFKVGEPDRYPPQLKEKLSEYIAAEPMCSAIWVRLMKASDGSVSWLIAADMNLKDEELRYELDNLARFAEPFADGLKVMAISAKEEYIKPAIANVEPFVSKP